MTEAKCLDCRFKEWVSLLTKKVKCDFWGEIDRPESCDLFMPKEEDKKE